MDKEKVKKQIAELDNEASVIKLILIQGWDKKKNTQWVNKGPVCSFSSL